MSGKVDDADKNANCSDVVFMIRGLHLVEGAENGLTDID